MSKGWPVHPNTRTRSMSGNRAHNPGPNLSKLAKAARRIGSQMIKRIPKSFPKPRFPKFPGRIYY